MDENPQQVGAENKVTIEDIAPCKKKISIEIPEQTIKNTADEQYKTLRKEAVVPGFRKGRAPRRLLEKRFGKETSEQIKLKLLSKASESVVEENKLDVLREPDIDYEKIELPESGPLAFDFEVEVHPEFDLPELEGISVNKPKLKVEKKQIDKEIETLRKYSGLWTPKENDKVELDDKIIADATVKSDDAEEEKLDNIEIYARQYGYVGVIPVENLDEVLTGAKAGDVKNTTVEVPKTYYEEKYRGKKFDISIKIKEIKYLKPAPLDENFLQRLGVEDEKELREKIGDNLKSQLEQQTRKEMKQQIRDYLLKNTDFDLPTDIVADQANTILQRQYAGLFNQGLSREEIEAHMEQIKAGSEQQASQQLKSFFIMNKIAEKLDIDVTEEELNGHIAQLAIQRRQRPERLREQMEHNGSLAQFNLEMRDDKCISKLLESAKIKEVKPSTKTKKKEKTAKKTSDTKKKQKKKPKTKSKKKTNN